MYRPPYCNNAYYDCILDEFEQITGTYDKVIVVGDLKYDYTFDETLSKNPVHYIESLYDFRELVTSPMRVTLSTSTLIDIVLSNTYEIYLATEVLKTGISDHYCVQTVIDVTG
jgi:hypothetical protein